MAGHLTMRMVRLFNLMAVVAVGKEWCRPISECHGKKERLERNESIELGGKYMYSSMLQVGDWDGDGALDLIGLGTTVSMQLVDWDSDGDLDLLVFGLFEAGHSGWFYSRVMWPQVWLREIRANGTLGDLRTDDGGMQVVSEALGPSDTARFFERHSGTFRERLEDENPLKSIVLENTSTAHVVDWDNDGDWDILLGTSDARVRYFEQFHGVLHERKDEQNPFANVQVPLISAPHATDFDGDGDVDLILADGVFGGEDSRLHYYERTKDGSLVERVGAANPFSDFHWPYCSAITTIRWSPSHLPDLIVSSSRDDVSIYRRTAMRGMELRSFSADPFASIFVGPPAAIDPVDWDGDGDVDIIIGDGTGLRYFERSKDGLTELLGTANPLAGIVADDPHPEAADLDGDGDIDLLLGDGTGKVRYFERRGDDLVERLGADSPTAEVQSAEGRALPTVGDVNYDGVLDLLVDTQTAWSLVQGRWRKANISWPDGKQTGSSARMWGIFQFDCPSNMAQLDIVDWDSPGTRNVLVSMGGGKMAFAKGSNYSGFLRYGRTRDDEGFFDQWTFGYKRNLDCSKNLISARSTDWDSNQGMDLIVSQPHGTTKFYSRGFCVPPGACNGKGVCSSSGVCRCEPGYVGDCSACDEGYYSVTGGGKVRTCFACPKSDLGVCSGRGICNDDRASQNLAALNQSAMAHLAHGDGNCACNEASFHGKDKGGRSTCAEGGCSAGFREVRNQSDERALGLFYCEGCPPGTESSKGVTCLPCPLNTYSTGLAEACAECPGLFLRYRPDVSSSTCQLEVLQLLWAPIFFILGIFTCLLPLQLCYYEIDIIDATLQDQEVVISTHRAHFLLQWPWATPPLRLSGTGVPWLDSEDVRYRVKSQGREHLVLLDSTGKSSSMPGSETSTGRMRLDFWSSNVFCGFQGVPFGMLLVTLLALVITLAQRALQPLLAVLEALIALAIALVIFLWRKRRETPLMKSHARFLEQLSKQNPKPVPCERGPGRAISAAQLCEVYNFFSGFIRQRTMYYTVANVVYPVTKKKRLSYAELAGPQKVKWFVSHFWGTAFQHFTDAVCRHAQSACTGEWQQEPYWICSFSNNQHAVEDEIGSGWQECSFYLALQDPGCTGTAMVLDEKALPLTRAWCLFEVLQTLLLEEKSSSFQGLMLCTQEGVLNLGQANPVVAMAMAQRLAVLDLADARATCDKDEVMIRQLVQSMPGGFGYVNHFVREKIHHAMLNVERRVKEGMAEAISVLEDSLQKSESQSAISLHVTEQ